MGVQFMTIITGASITDDVIAIFNTADPVERSTVDFSMDQHRVDADSEETVIISRVAHHTLVS